MPGRLLRALFVSTPADREQPATIPTPRRQALPRLVHPTDQALQSYYLRLNTERFAGRLPDLPVRFERGLGKAFYVVSAHRWRSLVVPDGVAERR